MLKSMTGYGRAQRLFEKRDILVEIKSVNHRYFEFSARTPRAYSYLDERLKALTGEAVFRGKTEVSVNIFTTGGQDAQVTLNMDLARAYVDALREAGQTLGLRDDLSVSPLTRFGDLFQVSREQAGGAGDCPGGRRALSGHACGRGGKDAGGHFQPAGWH